MLELGDAFPGHFESTESGREVNWPYWLELDVTVDA